MPSVPKSIATRILNLDDEVLGAFVEKCGTDGSALFMDILFLLALLLVILLISLCLDSSFCFDIGFGFGGDLGTGFGTDRDRDLGDCD